MTKFVLKSVLGLVIIATVACSKKAKEDAAQDGSLPLGDSASISQESMNFNPAGSDSGTIAGLSTVNFAFDSSVLDSNARAKLKENTDWMKTNSRYAIQIEGHCDSRGSVEYNLALGERRAKVVRDYMRSLGVDSNRMSIVSYGKEKLLELGDSEEVHARNRRANFVPSRN
jgi:peptidoglycan-associated lipoprotein